MKQLCLYLIATVITQLILNFSWNDTISFTESYINKHIQDTCRLVLPKCLYPAFVWKDSETRNWVIYQWSVKREALCKPL